MRATAVLATLVLLGLAAAGCGDDEPAPPSREDELARLRTEIAADAEHRADDPVQRVTCEPTTRGTAPPGSLDCLAITSEARATEAIPVPIALGQPYAARIDPATGRGDWCRVTPVAGEGATPSPEDVAALPARCGGSG